MKPFSNHETNTRWLDLSEIILVEEWVYNHDFAVLWVDAGGLGGVRGVKNLIYFCPGV